MKYNALMLPLHFAQSFYTCSVSICSAQNPSSVLTHPGDKRVQGKQGNHISTIHFTELVMCKLISFEHSLQQAQRSLKYQLQQSTNIKLLIVPVLKDNRLKPAFPLTFIKQDKPPISNQNILKSPLGQIGLRSTKNVNQNPNNSLNQPQHCSSSVYFRLYTVLLDSSPSKLLASRALSTDGSLTLFRRDSPAGIPV